MERVKKGVERVKKGERRERSEGELAERRPSSPSLFTDREPGTGYALVYSRVVEFIIWARAFPKVLPYNYYG